MKKTYLILIVLFVTAAFAPVVFAQTDAFRQEGIASWYGREFEGRPTASGEIFDSSKMTAAHPSLPFGTLLVVTNLHNNKSVTVRVNDRGPFVPARIVDVSRAAAEQLDMIVTGTAPVKIESIERNIPGSNVSSPVVGAKVPTQAVVAPQVAPVVVRQAVPVSESARETPLQETAPRVVIPDNIQTITAPVYVTQPAVIQPIIVQAAPSQLRISPASIVIVPEKNYRFQVGSFRITRNAVAAFDRLKSAGLSPNYERHSDSEGEYFRVVLANIRGNDVQSTSEKISAAGFSEAIIREEN